MASGLPELLPEGRCYYYRLWETNQILQPFRSIPIVGYFISRYNCRMTTDDPPKFIEFNGRKYQLEPCKRYYTRQAWSAAGPSSLHRAIWEHHYGPIPDYHDIHHKDENPLNNDISNLECVDRGKHHRNSATQTVNR